MNNCFGEKGTKLPYRPWTLWLKGKFLINKSFFPLEILCKKFFLNVTHSSRIIKKQNQNIFLARYCLTTMLTWVLHLICYSYSMFAIKEDTSFPCFFNIKNFLKCVLSKVHDSLNTTTEPMDLNELAHLLNIFSFHFQTPCCSCCLTLLLDMIYHSITKWNFLKGINKNLNFIVNNKHIRKRP